MKLVVTVLLLTLTISVYGKKLAPPPVFWNIFTVEVNKNTVTLSWTVTEYNNKVFYIQHSMNGRDWVTVDSVNTKNSPLTLDDYTFSYINKQEGRQYYRVKQVDTDMVKSGYSEVRTVIIRKEEQDEEQPVSVTLTPNPATDHIRIIHGDGSEKVTYTKAMIFDLTGKLVAERQLADYSNIVNIKDLPAGIYVMRAQGNNGTFFTQKIIKQ